MATAYDSAADSTIKRLREMTDGEIVGAREEARATRNNKDIAPAIRHAAGRVAEEASRILIERGSGGDTDFGIGVRGNHVNLGAGGDGHEVAIDDRDDGGRIQQGNPNAANNDPAVRSASEQQDLDSLDKLP